LQFGGSSFAINGLFRRSPALKTSNTLERHIWESNKFWAGIICCALSGCTSLGLRDDDEYGRARRAIESRSDGNGNFIRPEGRRAESKSTGVLESIKTSMGMDPKPKDIEKAKTIYAQAEALFEEAKGLEGDQRAARFDAAAKKFDEAAKQWPSSYLEQDALMMAGESYFFSEHYPKASERYTKLAKEYPRNRYQDRVDRRRMEIGNFWLQFPDKFYHLNLVDRKRPWNDTKNYGKKELEKLRLDSPTGKISDDATMVIANTAFLEERWTEALDTYNDLILTYPGSKHLFDAHLMGLQAALQSYAGPEYSQEPLEQAEKLLKNIVKFPEESRREKESIDRAYTDLQNYRAGYEFNRAMFRYNRGEGKAARMYCENILRDFSETAYAEPTRELLTKLEGMPDTPTRYLQSLTTLFPENDKFKPLIRPLPAEAVDSQRSDEISRTADRNSPYGASNGNNVGRR